MFWFWMGLVILTVFFGMMTWIAAAAGNPFGVKVWASLSFFCAGTAVILGVGLF